MTAYTSITWPAPFWPDDPAPADILWPSEQQPWSAALVAHYLERLSLPGELVLDPFAGQAALPRVACAHRRRLVLNNASAATLLGVLAGAAPPAAAVIDHAFSRMADAPRRGRTLAHHLAALYETVCPECAQTIVAERFVWDRAIGEPVEKRYRCPHCGSHGDAPADMADVAQVASLEVRGAAYWGLLSRLVKPGDPLTERARSLQDLYSPRALLVISELLTAADQRLSDGEERRSAKAMLLHVLAAGLSSAELVLDAGKNRLQLPRRFIENNLWLAFQHAHRTLRERAQREAARRERPLLQAADLARLRAPEGEGRVLPLNLTTPELAERLDPQSAALILTEPPPFDPAAYTLQVLWSGWLFGREAVHHQRAVLSMEQWSWDWYVRAMAAALRMLRPLLRPEGRLVLAFADPVPRRGMALLAAASAAGWRLISQATQAPLPTSAVGVRWRFELVPLDSAPSPSGADLADRLRRSAQEATQQLIALRGEPAPRALVQTACAVRWDELGLLAELPHHAEASRQPMSFLLDQMRLALDGEQPPPGMVFWSDDSTHGGLWWLEAPPAQPPLADRVEQFIAQRLETGPAAAEDLFEAAYAAFPGWQTPDAELLAACLESYGQRVGAQWRLREEDRPPRRDDDVAQIVRLAVELGRRLGYHVWCAAEAVLLAPDISPLLHDGAVEAEPWAPASVIWSNEDSPAIAFAITTQAALHPFLQPPAGRLATCARYVVLPGGRAGLLDFKLRRCPPWSSQLAWNGWEFVKFRHLRLLAGQRELNRATFRARIGLDPVISLPGQQLTLFNFETRGEAHDA